MKIITSNREEWMAALGMVFLIPFLFVVIPACMIIVGDQVVAGLTHGITTHHTNDVFIGMLPIFFVFSFIGLCLVALSPVSDLVRRKKT